MESSRENWSPGNPEGGSFEGEESTEYLPNVTPEYQKPEPTPEQELARIYNEYRPQVSFGDKGEPHTYIFFGIKIQSPHLRDVHVAGKQYGEYWSHELTNLENKLNKGLEDCYKGELEELRKPIYVSPGTGREYDSIEEAVELYGEREDNLIKKEFPNWKEKIASIELRYATETFLIAEKNEQLDTADRAYVKFLDGDIQRWEESERGVVFAGHCHGRIQQSAGLGMGKIRQ